MFPNTEVEVGGPDGPVLRCVSGAAVCRVALEDDRPGVPGGARPVVVRCPGGVRVDLTTADPLVQVSDGTSRSAQSPAVGAGDESTTVPGGRQLAMGPSGTLNEFRPEGLPEDERAAIAEYRESHLQDIQVLGERIDEASPPDESPGAGGVAGRGGGVAAGRGVGQR